jgi:hypothetical protein
MAHEFRKYRKLARDESTAVIPCGGEELLVREMSKVERDSKIVKPSSLGIFN